MVFEAAKFSFVSSQSRHLGFVNLMNLINVSSRPLPTSRQKVAVVVVKSEPLAIVYVWTEGQSVNKKLRFLSPYKVVTYRLRVYGRGFT